jgi:hypothetical protein
MFYQMKLNRPKNYLTLLSLYKQVNCCLHESFRKLRTFKSRHRRIACTVFKPGKKTQGTSGVRIWIRDLDPGSGAFLTLDLGSGAFLTSGSGIRDRFFPDPGSQIQDPRSQTIILRAR